MAKKSNEMPPIYCMRMGDKLHGEMQYDRDMIAAMPAGARIKVSLSTGRRPARLRSYFAFLNEVVKSTECAPNKEALHETIKMELGYTTKVRLRGYQVLVPRSVAFSSMTEEEFSAFYSQAVKFIAENFGVSPEDVRENAA